MNALPSRCRRAYALLLRYKATTAGGHGGGFHAAIGAAVFDCLLQVPPPPPSTPLPGTLQLTGSAKFGNFSLLMADGIYGGGRNLTPVRMLRVVAQPRVHTQTHTDTHRQNPIDRHRQTHGYRHRQTDR
jgi:hypothetical protein